MIQLLAVGLGGFVGAVSRWVLTGFVQRHVSPAWFPAGTLAVNLLGCLVIGVLMTLVTHAQQPPATWRLFLVTGILGSLTTFSTFGYETFELLREQQVRMAVLSVAANLVFGLLAVWAGRSLTLLALVAR